MLDIALRLDEEGWRLHLPRPKEWAQRILTRCAQALERRGKLEGFSLAGYEVSIVLTNDQVIQELNRAYRRKNKPTNVLSFPLHSAVPTTLLGDIVLSYETCVAEANVAKKPFLHHATHLLIHGFLHLLGYDHLEDDAAEEMEELEKDLLVLFAIPNPYEKS